MIRIVEGVQEIAVERVDVRQARKCVDGGGEALDECLGCEFDLSCIEGSNSANLETRTDLSGQSKEIFVSCLLFGVVCSWRLESANLGARVWFAQMQMGWVTYLLWVLDSTMSRNSWLVGTAGMSFHWVFILATAGLLGLWTRSALREGRAGKKFEALPIDTKKYSPPPSGSSPHVR